jgi:hypothetical protein
LIATFVRVVESASLNHAFGKSEPMMNLNTPMIRGWMVGENRGLAVRKIHHLNMLKASMDKAKSGSKLAATLG